MTETWRMLSDAEREREYSPSSCVDGDIEPFLISYVERSAAAHAACAASGNSIIELRYGEATSNTVDLVLPAPTGSPTPLLVFIHGGYWQELSKRESFFAASDSLSHDIAFAAVDYTLAPHASLDEIVDECQQAVRKLRDAAPDHHVDPRQIIVAGSSAGSHLAAMVGLGQGDGWRPAAIALVSGIFDLEPLIGTSINDALQLDITAAHRNSPLRHDLEGFPPTLIAYGNNETSEFKWQSQQLAALLARAEVPVTVHEIPGRNHFDVILDLVDANTILGSEILRLIGDVRRQNPTMNV